MTRARSLVVAGTVAIALALGGLAAWRAHAPTLAASAATKVEPLAAPPPDVVRLSSRSSVVQMIRVQTVATSPLPLTDTLPARVSYDEDATVRVTASFSGRIVRLIASTGDVVKIGAPLAEIDSPDFGLAAADLSKARADEEHKRLTLQRSRDLLAGGVVPQKDVEAAEADFVAARAETTRAAQRVHNLNPSQAVLKGGDFLLASPMAGVVTERTANPAMEVGPTLVQPLFVISDLRRLWVLIDLPERLLGKATNGTRVSIDSDAYPGRTFDATIVHVAQVLDPGTRRIAVRARVDNQGLALRPEMFVRATLVGEDGHGVRVPNEAVVNEGLYSYVFVKTGETDYRRVRVDAVIRGAESSYLGTGLAGGEQVVVAGALLLAAEQSTAQSTAQGS